MKSNLLAVSVLSFLFIYSMVFAIWSEPVHLAELNDMENGYIAAAPQISSDGNIINYVRSKQSNTYYLFEAYKNAETGLFENERVLSELGPLGGRLIFGTWMSEDSKRLYYCWSGSNINGRWGRTMSMATREDSNDIWNHVKRFYELEVDYYLASVSLTSDELNIMWKAMTVGGTPGLFYMSTRSSISEPFSDIKEVSELNQLGINNPYLSSDGLAVYFDIFNADGCGELWSGVRSSLEEPFGDFLPIEAINQPGSSNYGPCISPDGSALYFVKSSPEMGKMDWGIYVSYWVETPYEFAMRSLDEAVAAKQQARQLLDEATEKEIAAAKALCQINLDDLPQGLTCRQLHHARIAIYQALQRQFIAHKNVSQALSYLGKALGILEPSPVSKEQKTTTGSSNQKPPRKSQEKKGK